MSSLSTQTLSRPRVIAALEKAVATHGLVVLTAPLGHGKTTIAQELIERRTARSVYLKLKSGWQNNAEYLWSQLCERLEKQGVSDAGALRLIGFPYDDARMYRCLDVLRAWLSASPTLLVVDDFHHADNTPLARLFENLVAEEISGFTVLILSRTRPDLHLAYLQAQGYAAVLEPSLLDFSRDEARQMFDAAGMTEHALADMAWDVSGGWAAALRMSLQSSLAEGTVRPFTRIEELVSDTFAETYSPEDQCLLLTLSVLGTFTAEQAVLVSGRHDAPLRLRRMYEQNAFLHYSPLTGAYSLHALLVSFLQQTLAGHALPVCGAIDLPLLYRRAAECSLASRNFLQAMRLFAQAGSDEDLLRILGIFEEAGEGFFMLPDPDTVRGIIDAIPWRIRFLSPVGYLGFIHRYAVRVSRAEAKALMLEAESRFLDQERFPEDLQREIRGELELIRAVTSFNDIEAICRCYEAADNLLRGRSKLVNKVMFWTYNCPHSAFLYLKEPGGYAALEQLVSEKLVHFQNVSGGANAGAVELLAAERRLETGRPHDTDLLLTGKYKAEESEQYPGILAANFTLARYRMAEGRADGIYDLFEALRKPMEQRANSLLLQNLEVCLGYVASVRNDVERIPSWLIQHDPLTIRNNQAHAFTLVVRGKSIMVLKNWPRLLAFAEELEQRTAPLGSLFCRLHGLLFKAVATSHMQKHNTALSEKYLLQAVALAKPDGILASIGEYGMHLYPLLHRIGNLYPERRDIGSLRRMAKHYAKLGHNDTSNLTLHEKDIMNMVRTGSNNKDIGAKLGMTQGSVANSLSRIYAKLGVGSRIEAINKWTEESAGDEAG